LSLKRSAESNNGEHRHRDSQQRMGNQDGEIDYRNGPSVVLRSDLRVVDQVGDQEQDRGAKRGDHHLVVRIAFPIADQGVADGEQNCGRAIKDGVQGREIVDGQNRSFATRFASAISLGMASSSEVR
jgi:hypothetical protein